MVPRSQAVAARRTDWTRLRFALVVVSLLTLPSATNAQAAYQVVAAFGAPGGEGRFPFAGLLLASDFNFYGTTNGGGAFAAGSVYKLDASGTFTTLHSFNFTEGAEPFATLTEGRDGRLYGTTRTGGPADLGTVFAVDPAGVFTMLHAFNFDDGAYPFESVIQATDGMLYGTTAGGGLSSVAPYGTVFRIDTAGVLTTLHFFNHTDGAWPTAGVIQGSDGNLYGTTTGGGIQHAGQSFGTVFKLDSSGTLTTLHEFTGPDGAEPFAGLTEASSGILYGTTVEGGAHGRIVRGPRRKPVRHDE